jgi:hypothetical protein
MISLSLKDAKDIADSIRPDDNSFPIVAVVKALREIYAQGYEAACKVHLSSGTEKVIRELQDALNESNVRIDELRAVIRSIARDS